jgi:hypothetical protein
MVPAEADKSNDRRDVCGGAMNAARFNAAHAGDAHVLPNCSRHRGA